MKYLEVRCEVQAIMKLISHAYTNNVEIRTRASQTERSLDRAT